MNLKSIQQRIFTCAVLSLLWASSAMAQDYPSKPVRVVVPFAAGGGADVIGRIMAQSLTTALGQPFVVENRSGASGNIGADLVAKSANDGYTLLFGGTNLATNPSLYDNLSYNPLKDFAPISQLTAAPYVLLVNPSVPARNFREFLALAKSAPGKTAYGSTGLGTPGQLAMESIKAIAKVDLLHVPFNGSTAMMTALTGGHVMAGFDNMLTAVPFVTSNRLRALAVSGGKRSPALPDVPTISEAGLPGFEAYIWQGVLAPAGTPRAILDKLQTAIAREFSKPDVRERMAGLGVEIIASTPQDFAAFLKRDTERYAEIIRFSGAKLR
ncbi:MAG: tripartite tricarboxylate transporter substrate binding protein [Burkholderiaceae bacterium]|nr:tripartite tricarboxylate transporter substrate binding protein [Burkholderiaceae bacterium]